MDFDTLAVHSGHPQNADLRPSSPAIDRSVSWSYDSMAALDAVFEGRRPGYDYGRDGMPTPALLEQALTALEAGRDSVVFATGMAAIAAVLAQVKPGQRLLATPDLYGLTFRLVQDWLPEQGIEVRWCPPGDAAAMQENLQSWRPHWFLIETLSNPLVRVADLQTLISAAHAVDCRVMVDNTFATPYLCRPAALGADFTVESLTKYINGHGDVLGGSVTVVREEDAAALRQQRKIFGATLDPFAAWLALRGLRTLGLRMQRHSDNALALARFLDTHDAVTHVYYPGLPGHLHHDLARTLFGDHFGGMLAFDVQPATRQRAWQVMDRLQIAVRAPTLGDYATLVSYPAHASHRLLTPAQRQELGIGEGCIRVSVGIEAAADIIADFAQALAA